MADYHINVFWRDEGGAWIADIPDLSGCSASGSTAEEAVREIQVAKELWLTLTAARELGRDIPPPRYRPAIYAS
jgi:predicted RNase H-like HicB family nuclease